MDYQGSNKRLKGPDGNAVGARAASTHAPGTRLAEATSSSGSSSISRSRQPARPLSPRSADSKPSIRLTVKAPPSKLRQALSNDLPPSPYAHDEDDEDGGDTPEPPVRSARSTRNPRTVVEPDSDDDDDDDAGSDDDGEDDEDAEGEGEIDAELLAAEDSDGDMDAEVDDDDDEDADADTDGRLDMRAPHPPPPIIRTNPTQSSAAKGKAKVNVTVTVPHEGALTSVEEREEEDEELSDLESDGLDVEDGEDDDGEGDDDEDDDERGSRSGTPDMSKLTRRQRAVFEEMDTDPSVAGGLMALSNEAQKKKHLTAEEHAMRRAEMARRRKNLSEKRNEEEKMDTINKLLNKPAPKRRTRAEMMAAAAADGMPGWDDGDREGADPLYVRWINNARGSRIGVPQEWLQSPLGDALKPGWTGPKPNRALVEEVA